MCCRTRVFSARTHNLKRVTSTQIRELNVSPPQFLQLPVDCGVPLQELHHHVTVSPAPGINACSVLVYNTTAVERGRWLRAQLRALGQARHSLHRQGEARETYSPSQCARTLRRSLRTIASGTNGCAIDPLMERTDKLVNALHHSIEFSFALGTKLCCRALGTECAGELQRVS